MGVLFPIPAMRHLPNYRLAALCVVLVLAACSGGGDDPPVKGNLSGTLTLVASAPQVLAQRAGPGDPVAPLPDATEGDAEADAVAGEVVAAIPAGYTASDLALEAGLVCVAEGGGWCLLRDPAPEARSADRSARVQRARAHCDRLRMQCGVRAAEPNFVRRLTALPTDPYADGNWALEQIRAFAAWELDPGELGMIVAVVDSGIKAGHPDLAGRILPGWDFQGDDDNAEDPTFGASHGTMVSGIIAAAGNNAIGVAGLLWNGRILPVRAFNTSGTSTAFEVSQAILYAAGLPNSSGQLPAEPARVINLSFATTSASAVERDACDAARSAGALLVAASGNNATSAVHYPAGYDSVMGVGATDLSGARAGYSNYGSWIDLVAPGGSAWNGVRVVTVEAGSVHGYGFANGTSFAAPHVSGVAALVLGVRDYTPAQLAQLLSDTAQDVGSLGFDLFTGHGVVDAYRAVATAIGEPIPALIPGEEIEVRLIDNETGTTLLTVTTKEAQDLTWTIREVPVGEYRIEAGTDRNFDGDLDDPGEVYGEWRDALMNRVLIMIDDSSLVGLDFTISPR